MKKVLNFIFIWLIVLNFFNFSLVKANDVITKPLRITEINWAGSSYSSSDEWLEIQNISDTEITLNNYFIRGIKTNQDIPLTGILPAKGYFLIANNDPKSGNSALKTEPDLVTNISISNSKFHISIIYKENGQEILVDEVNTANSFPFAGTNSSSTVFGRASMERINPNISGNIPTNWKTAEFAINLKLKTNESQSILDLGSPKSASINFTEIPFHELIPIKTKHTEESTVPIDASLNGINLFTLKSNLISHKKYNIRILSEAESTQYNSTIELKTKDNQNQISEKQFINGANNFIYINDSSKSIEISAIIQTESIINLKSLIISVNEIDLNQMLLDTKNCYSDGKFIDNQFSLNTNEKVLISRSLNEITSLSRDKNVIFSSKIKVTPKPSSTNILEIKAINTSTKYEEAKKYTSDDVTNGLINIDFDFLVSKSGNTFIAITIWDDNQLLFSEGSLNLFDAEKFIENINIANFIEDKENTTKIDVGLKINNYKTDKVKFANINLCKGKNLCKVSFLIKNNSSELKSLRIAFGYKNQSTSDFQTRYFDLTNQKDLVFNIENKNKDSSKIQIILSGNIKNIEISDLIAISDNTKRNFLTSKTATIGVYKNEFANTHGFKGQINDIFETNTLQAGKYKFSANINSDNKNLTSNFSIVRITAYNRIGTKLFEENITEKELKNLNGLFSKEFECKRNSKIIISIKYFGTHKKAKANIEISNIKIENIP